MTHKVLITMLKTTPGSPDGATVTTYEEDKDYSVPLDLARAFIIDMKVARISDDEPDKEEIEQRLAGHDAKAAAHADRKAAREAERAKAQADADRAKADKKAAREAKTKG